MFLMSNKEMIKFRFTTCEEDFNFVVALLKKVYSIPRILSMFLVSVGCMVIFATVIKNGNDLMPLLVFNCLISFIFLVILVRVILLRPELVNRCRAHIGNEVVASFSSDGIEIVSGDEKRNPDYKAVRNQFWKDDRYCLIIDSQYYKDVLVIPVNEETFDSLFRLARKLEGLKKRLIKLK